MQVAPVGVGGGRVVAVIVTTFVGGIVMMTEGANV
jgi:hypothetical protein